MNERVSCPNCGGWRSHPWSAGLKVACSDCGAVWTRGGGADASAATEFGPAPPATDNRSGVVMPISPTVRRALRLPR